MPIPIRCFSCGKVIANKYEEYLERTSNGEQSDFILTDMGYKRMCCRRMFITHSNKLDEDLALYFYKNQHSSY